VDEASSNQQRFLANAAHQDGLVVLARMDSSRVAEDFYRAHPDWMALQQSGEPYQVAERYITCVNSAYYDEYLPNIFQEIIERSHPEGFGDNSWSGGLNRNQICYCDNCARKFRERTGQSLPKQKDWNDSVYRKWIEWNYARRMELWDNNTRVTQESGGPHCLWLGMNSGSVTYQSLVFRDFHTPPSSLRNALSLEVDQHWARHWQLIKVMGLPCGYTYYDRSYRRITKVI